MNETDALLNEYNNLWQEKLIHKQSIRRFHNYITYLISMGSLALTFKGVSTTDFFNTMVNKGGTQKLVENAADIAMLLFVPFTPVVLIILTFAINDLYQVYVIGTQIGCIEIKINSLLGTSGLLSWEHRICPVIYGGAKNIDNEKSIKPLSNIISLNDFMIFFPSLAIVCILTSIFGALFLYTKFHIAVFWLYILMTAYLFLSIVYIGLKLFRYTRKENPLKADLKTLNNL